jgi:hypothetical protein
MGSGLDDWIYWHFFTGSNYKMSGLHTQTAVTTAHKIKSSVSAFTSRC